MLAGVLDREMDQLPGGDSVEPCRAAEFSCPMQKGWGFVGVTNVAALTSDQDESWEETAIFQIIKLADFFISY
jgi:hypothetical protein